MGMEPSSDALIYFLAIDFEHSPLRFSGSNNARPRCFSVGSIARFGRCGRRARGADRRLAPALARGLSCGARRNRTQGMRRLVPRTRSFNRCPTPVRRNGIALMSRGSSSNFCCGRLTPAYRSFDERFAYLFNSYYVAAGPRQARPQRGLITRPGVAETTAYRAHVDAAVAALIEYHAGHRSGHPDRRDRAQSRAAASGTDADRHPARICAKRDQSGLRCPLALAAKRERTHHSRRRIRRTA